MAVALALGPVRLAARAALRAAGGRPALRWQGAATAGLSAGLLAAPLVAGASLGGPSAVWASLLGLMLLLSAQDLAWRWLPFEWTLPLLALGFVAGFLGDMSYDTFLGALIGGGLLLTLQLSFRLARGVEALGTGDIWLAAGLGAFSGPATIAWVLALAALSGLAVEALRKKVPGPGSRNRWGVAYGAHSCAAFLIVSAF
jgi:leader peptidase (prepilin peptidase) / N-methyltransferase